MMNGRTDNLETLLQELLVLQLLSDAALERDDLHIRWHDDSDIIRRAIQRDFFKDEVAQDG